MPYYSGSGEYHRDGCTVVALGLEPATHVERVPEFAEYTDCPGCRAE